MVGRSAGKAATAVAKVAPAISTYSALAANPYGQILANTVSVEDMTGKDAFYKEEEKMVRKLATCRHYALIFLQMSLLN